MKRSFTALLLAGACREALAFKSTSIQPSYGSGGGNGKGGNAYRRPRQGSSRGRSTQIGNNGSPPSSSSRSPISIHQESSCIVRLAAGDESNYSIADNNDVSNSERKFSAASTEKTEILVASGNDADDITTTPINKAATSTVNERLLSEIQASVDKEKYGSGKTREYFKEFQSQKTDEERERSIEEARDLNGEYLVVSACTYYFCSDDFDNVSCMLTFYPNECSFQ